MSRNRFQLIQRYLHFNDNNAAGTNEDRLYKIRTILDIVVNNFRTNYIPDREISLDQGMLGWRGRLQFRVYNPRKCFSIFSSVAFSTVMLPIQRIILIRANRS